MLEFQAKVSCILGKWLNLQTCTFINTFFKNRVCYVVQDVFELIILLLQPLECWNHNTALYSQPLSMLSWYTFLTFRTLDTATGFRVYSPGFCMHFNYKPNLSHLNFFFFLRWGKWSKNKCNDFCVPLF